MRFSVIVPIYKVEKYLNQCVDSILSQSFNDFEVILVDDGSPDNCPKICDEYAEKDSRIKVVHKENGGLSDARNSGVSVAEGEYLIFIDSDDYYVSNEVFETISKRIDIYKPDIVQYQTKWFYEDSDRFFQRPNFDEKVFNELSPSETIKKLIQNNLLHSSAWQNAVSREFFISNDLFFKKGIKSEDIEWSFRVFSNSLRICVISDSLYTYRKREGSITSTIDYKHLLDYCDFLEETTIRFERNKTEVNEYLLSVVMYHVLICSSLCYNAKCTKKQKKELLKRLKVIAKGRITKYKLDSRVKLASKIYRFFGFKAMSFAMGYYLKHRKQGSHSFSVVEQNKA